MHASMWTAGMFWGMGVCCRGGSVFSCRTVFVAILATLVAEFVAMLYWDLHLGGAGFGCERIGQCQCTPLCGQQVCSGLSAVTMKQCIGCRMTVM